MPKIPLGPEPPDKVFNLATPNHLYYKLLWEQRNLIAALDDKDSWLHSPPSFHAFNFAITAAHLVDWVWAVSDDESRNRMSETLGNLPVTSRRKFREAVGAKHRAIHICGQISNGSKHYETTKHPDNDPAIEVSVEWDYAESVNDDKYRAETVLRIRDGADSRLATEVFCEAVEAWGNLLRAWGYLEPLFVPGVVRRGLE